MGRTQSKETSENAIWVIQGRDGDACDLCGNIRQDDNIRDDKWSDY